MTSGKAIITGANGNLGQVLVKSFLSAHFEVAGIVRKKSTTSYFDGKAYHEVVANLSQEAEVTDIFNDIMKSEGKIDVAVLAAGGFAMGELEDTGQEALRSQYETNFLSAYFIARKVFSHMISQNGGRIFLFGSRPGMIPETGSQMIAYTLSKSLIFDLAKILNHEGKKNNVITTVIVPGTIDTPANGAAMPDADRSGWTSPEAIANTIVWYASPDANGIRQPVIEF